ncbi:MAG TPA: flagellar biosynthetic protein FliO [Acidobacteriota bacterium]|nr:flagellar biosynthetic protein FliO [Acidobacteriota bacterium]
MIYAQSFMALALVLGLVWLFYRLFMHLQNRLGLSGPDRSIQVEERTSLGDKRQLLVVQVDGQRYLLGATSSNISLVSALGEKPEPQAEEDASDNAAAESRPGFKSFRSLLGEMGL